MTPPRFPGSENTRHPGIWQGGAACGKMAAMSIPEPSFTIGIEEEYHLVDLETRDLASTPPPALMERCKAALENRVSPEFLRSQIEIGTNVCQSLDEARTELADLRGTVARVAREYGCAPIAVSTHPFAHWAEQRHTNKERYNVLAEDMQVVVRRLLICGMHVHVGIDHDDLRIDLLSQAAYFLPHLMALSTSSPFWHGELTGLKSYRLSGFDELPRTGPPPQFSSYGEYTRTVDVLIKAGIIEDATKIWWDLRPSARFPTLEMRISDVCPLLEDTLTIAALFRCLCRMLYRLRRNNQRWRTYPTFLIRENRWRAQRYGISEGLIDLGRGEIVPYAELLEELLELIQEDAEYFGCVAEVEHARQILARGTSADRQMARYAALTEKGVDHDAAMRQVVDDLIAETLVGT